MWSDAVDDEKLRLLAFEDRWHFVALLCLKRSGLLDEPESDLKKQKICVKLGLDSVELETAMKRLVTVGLINEALQPLAWGKRQFESDSSTSRVRAFRKRQRNEKETFQKRPQTTDSDTETDSEKNALREKTPSERRARAHAARRVPGDFSPDLDLARRELPGVDAEREAQKFRDHEFKRARSDWSAAWRNWVETCRESGRYARLAQGGGVGLRWSDGTPVRF